MILPCVRTDNVSAEHFSRIIFWLFWQNKLSGPKSYVGRNAETPLFRQKWFFFRKSTRISAKVTSFTDLQLQMSDMWCKKRCSTYVHILTRLTRWQTPPLWQIQSSHGLFTDTSISQWSPANLDVQLHTSVSSTSTHDPPFWHLSAVSPLQPAISHLVNH